jgi:colanic acid/amylovoran biosynthesis glycosyltransferase
MPARILFLIDELDFGGTEQQLLELLRRLDRSNYDPMVCCFRPGRVAAEIQAIGVRVVHLPKRHKIDLRLILALVRLIRRNRFEIVQTYLFTANTWGRLAALLAGVRVILTSERNVDIWEEPYKRLIGRWLDRWTRATIANSQAVKDYLVAKGLPAHKIRVIYNGVDATRFSTPPSTDEVKAHLGIPAAHAVVGLLARLEPQKDPSTFLRAAASIAAKHSDVSFLMIGGGSLEAALAEEAQRLGIRERLVITGGRRDIARLLAACDVSVISSIKEGMSNAVMESMAAGKPVVVTRVGGNAELVIDGETGFVVPPRDATRLAEAICSILEDPARATEIGRRARRRMLDGFSVDAMVTATQSLYDAVARPSDGTARAFAPSRDNHTIALVVSQFPRYVDAYFLREIKALADRGIRFRIFSLMEFRGKVIHEDARAFLPDTVNVPFLLSTAVLAAQVRALCRTPGRYLGTLATVVRGTARRPRALAKTLAVFPKSVYFGSLVREEGIRRIHANWATHPATAAFIMSRLADVPFSFTGHASDIYLDTTMLAEKIQAAEFVVTCTRHNEQYLGGLAGDAAARKIAVSYHGLDLKKFSPVPKHARDRFRILAVGTLLECKGFPDLIEACRVLESRNVLFDCTIVGDGPERKPLEALIRRSGLTDHVKISGYVAQEHLIPLYQGASVVVLPALPEGHFGIPNVLLEALAVETPVICSALPSLAEVMEDGVEGMYVPPRDPMALAEALASLAGDPDRVARMGRAGRHKIEQMFDIERTSAGLETLLRGDGRGTDRPRGASAAGSEAQWYTTSQLEKRV